MSLWDRLKGWVSSSADAMVDAPGAKKANDPSTPTKPPTEEPAKATAEERFAALVDGRHRPDGTLAVELLDTLHARGRTARGLELARKILARWDDLDVFALRVAELLAERGDDRGARQQLTDLLGGAREGAPLPALVLAAEIDERLGDVPSALALYERVLAHDLDFPRARARAERLRASRGREANLAGATIATQGALTRGRYRVEQELGRGGAGTVFAASDLALERRVALKVYHRRGRIERERLLAEARTPARIEHPGVVRIFDLDERLGAILMEWVHGGSVRRQLTVGDVSLARVRRWMGTALEALHFVHSRGFVHRDVKPSNFLLRADDRVVLTDFGLAMELGDTPKSATGLGEGTLRYMPPEQRSGAPAHPSADVYALGVTLRELLEATAERDEGLEELAAACTRKAGDTRPQVEELLGALAASPTDADRGGGSSAAD